MSADLVESPKEDTEWKDIFHFPYGEEGGLINFCADNGKTGYLTSSLGRETTALLKVDLKTGETLEEIYSNDKCNVGSITLEKDTKELRALTYNYARTVRTFLRNYLNRLLQCVVVCFTLTSCHLVYSSRNVYSMTRNLRRTMNS